jgi:hypothetical protein
MQKAELLIDTTFELGKFSMDSIFKKKKEDVYSYPRDLRCNNC